MFFYLYFKYQKKELIFDREIKQTLNNHFGVVKSIKSLNNGFLLLVKSQDNLRAINEYLNHYIVDNLVKTKVFITNSYDSINLLDKHFNLFKYLINKYYGLLRKNVLTFKDLLIEVSKSQYNIEVSKVILRKYFLDNEMKQLLVTLFENNLNILKTARDLSMHRNTVIYRLDAFTKHTSLNPRIFNEAYIIKSLYDF